MRRVTQDPLATQREMSSVWMSSHPSTVRTPRKPATKTIRIARSIILVCPIIKTAFALKSAVNPTIPTPIDAQRFFLA